MEMEHTHFLVNLKFDKNRLPIYQSTSVDYTEEWGRYLQANEEQFPFEASYANHYFPWPHIIEGELRVGFDCTDPNSFRIIPPNDYVNAYQEAKESGQI